MSVYGVLNETLESTNYLYRLSMYESNFLDNIFNESYNDFEAINEAIDFKKIKEKLNWKNIWEWIKGIFAKLGEAISNLVKKIRDFFTGKKKKETEAKLKALEKELEELKIKNIKLTNDKEKLSKEIDEIIKDNEDYKQKIRADYDDLASKVSDRTGEIYDLKDKLILKDKEINKLTKEKDEKANDVRNLNIKITNSLTAQLDSFNKAINDPRFYFDMYDYFNEEYDPMRVVRSDWFDKIERYFGGKMNYDDDTDKIYYKYPSDIKEISGSFDLFIKECGKKLHIFNDDFSKFLDEDFYINFHSYRIEKIIDAKLEEKMNKEKSKYPSPEKVLEHMEWLNDIMHGQSGNLEELIRKFSDIQNRAQQILNKIVAQCQKNNPDANQAALNAFQTEVSNFISFINKQIQLLAILSTYCARSIGLVESVVNVSKIFNTSITASK